MLIDTTAMENGLALVALSGDLNRASALHNLTEVILRLHGEGRRGILLDLGKVRRLNMAGLAALVELVARHPKTDMAFCKIPEKPLAFLRKSGLDRGLRIFETIEEARAHPIFREHALSGVRTVLLCAGTGNRIAPLSHTTPKPMLDIAGRPVLHRIIDHLEGFGLRDILLNPGHLGHQVIDYFRQVPMPDTRISFVNEGRWTQGNWTAEPIGSASTLKRMQVETAAFDTDIVVLCGDALIDLDLADMMREHRQSGADATIAALSVPDHAVHKYGIIEAGLRKTVARFLEKPTPEATESRLANSGVYIFRPEVLSLLPDGNGLDIARNLLPEILNKGGTIHVHDRPFRWIDVGCVRDYAVAATKCLEGNLNFALPIGREIRQGVWAMPGAEVSPKARISGPCHIGTGARVEAGALLEGVCSIGVGALVRGGTVLRDCMVMPGTSVNTGAWADGMILHGEWAINHTTADGSARDITPMDCVAVRDPASPQEHRATA